MSRKGIANKGFARMLVVLMVINLMCFGIPQTISFAADLGGVNLALNKAATDNGNTGSSSDASKAVDGKDGSKSPNNTKWCSTINGEKWMSVDLGQVYIIGNWVVEHAGAGGENIAWNTKNFKLQKSSDGSKWTDVDIVTDNTASITNRNVTPFASRYVRLSIPNHSTDPVARIYEFKIYSGSGDIAWNKITTDNGSVNSNEVSSKAVDGIGYTKWCSTTTGNKWISIDLGDVYSIGNWVVKHAGAGGESASLNTKNFKLQKSSDGDTWTDVDTVTDNTANITNRTVTPFDSRYVRLDITTPTSTGDTAARIYTFELYAPTITTAGIAAATTTEVSYAVTLAANDSDAVVLIALYGINNDMLAVKTVSASDTSVGFENASSTNFAKLFVWESLTTIKPLSMDNSSINQE